jgi:tRNA 2-thiouridine synthesizing protein A
VTAAPPGLSAEVLVNARGLRCPWPVLRLARAVREHPAGTRIRVIADDPAAPGEIAALAAERGWTIVPEKSAESGTIIVVS